MISSIAAMRTADSMRSETRDGRKETDRDSEARRLWLLAESLTGDPELARRALAAVLQSDRGSALSEAELRLRVARTTLRLLPDAAVDPSIRSLLPEFGDDGVRQAADTRLQPQSAPPTRSRVRAQIQKLPELQRRALLLRDVHGFETEHVAGLLDLDRAEALQRIHEGRMALRELLMVEERAF